MAQAQVIQLKRSQVTPTPPSLATGECAFSEASMTLFIGLADGSVLAIAGPGIFAKLANANLTGTPTAPTPATNDNSTKIATTAFVVSRIAGLAAGDMSKSAYDSNNDGVVNDSDKLGGAAASLYALKSYVDSAISNLVGGAGTALDQLNEIATALGNDPNFATTIMNALGLRLRFDAPQTLTAPQLVQAFANLGLGTLAKQDASNVAITGGSISGVTLDGGTF
jgi:hypothetical protein